MASVRYRRGSRVTVITGFPSLLLLVLLPGLQEAISIVASSRKYIFSFILSMVFCICGSVGPLLCLFLCMAHSFVLDARSISRLPPGGPGRRSTLNPMACKSLRITPFAQYVVSMPLLFMAAYMCRKSSSLHISGCFREQRHRNRQGRNSD